MSGPWVSFGLLTQFSMPLIWIGFKNGEKEKEFKGMLLSAISESKSGHGGTMLTWDKDQVYIQRR